MQITDRFVSAPASAVLPACAVAAEHSAFILVNEQPVFQVLCTPAQLPELALGRLLTEGLIRSAAEVESIHVCAEGKKISVHLNHPTAYTQGIPEVATCCTDNISAVSAAGRAPLCAVPRLAVSEADIRLLAQTMESGLPLYAETRSAHCAMLLHNGTVIACSEDLGRHNALDKVVGTALCRGVPLGECILFTSGRMPVDMVRKAIRAGVPVLVSKTLPTLQSVELAQQYGLTLIGRAGAHGHIVFV